jgi:polysaccharide export outer membrane protein
MKSCPVLLWTVWLWLGALVSPLALAQAPAATTTVGARAPASPKIADEGGVMLLGPGDSVNMEVYGQPDLTTTMLVGDDGKINVPLAGPVSVAHMTPIQAAVKVEKSLKDGRFLVDPHVNLNIVTSKSQRVSVLGQVSKPGRYPIEPNTTIFELLAEVGGENENGADIGYITRKDDQGQTVRIPVNLKDPDGRKTSLPPVALKGGDELYVPKVEKFYIYGEVSSPGMYSLEPGMTVIQAIARAGGITPRGSERRVEVKRAAKDGTTVVSKVRGNDSVQPSDVLRVKESLF